MCSRARLRSYWLSGGTKSDDVPGHSVRSFTGDGDRQYLSGLKIGGKRIFLLVDASASMLAEDIVNAVRRRHFPPAPLHGDGRSGVGRTSRCSGSA